MSTALRDRDHGGLELRYLREWITPSISVQREPLDAVRDELGPLLRDHWDAVPPDDEGHVLEPHWPAYEAMERVDALRIYTLRDLGILQGYVVAIVGPALHSRTSLRASMDLWYLAPALRQGLLGVHLLRWSEDRLAAEGVDLICHGTRQARVGTILRRMGYEDRETVWVKPLTGRKTWRNTPAS